MIKLNRIEELEAKAEETFLKDYRENNYNEIIKTLSKKEQKEYWKLREGSWLK